MDRRRESAVLAPDESSYTQLAIVEKYERFVEYIYPVLQNAPRKHGIARDAMLRCMFDQAEMFIVAGKSKQISRLYSADANLSLLRFWLRFMAASKRKIVTPHQHRVALVHLAEVGRMLGAWMKSMKGGGRDG